MRVRYSLLMLATAAVMGCATSGVQSGTAAGAVGPAVLASTAVVRADNRHGSNVALYVRQNGFGEGKVFGPLQATKGSIIRLTLTPILANSLARVF